MDQYWTEEAQKSSSREFSAKLLDEQSSGWLTIRKLEIFGLHSVSLLLEKRKVFDGIESYT